MTGPALLATACSSSPASNGDAAVALAVAHPNLLISPAGHDYPASAGNLVAGNYHVSNWNVGMLPASAAIQLMAGPTRLLLSWDDGGTYDYQDPTTTTVYGFPAAYTIETSANSTNGTDGTWNNVVTVSGNQVRTRAHSFDFTGMSWVRMTMTAAPPNESSNGVQLGQIDVHDISATPTGIPDDTWFFMGDSITAFAYDRSQAHQPSFAATINTNTSGKYFPAMINGGIGGEASGDGLARLAADLLLNPDYRFWVLGYGTNDAANDQVSTATFQTNMQSMITMVQAAGRIPMIPHIPYSGDGAHGDIPLYDTVIDTLTTTNGLLTGPDFYGYFMANQADFVCGCSGGRATDNLHPNDVGLQEMNALWATAPAVAALYH